LSSGMTDRSGSSFGRRDMASAQWCSLPGLVHALYKNTDNRRRQLATRPCALCMLSSQRILEWSVQIRKACPSS